MGGPAAWAIEPDTAKIFVRALADKAITVVKSDDLGKQEQSKRLREILRESFDIRTIGNFALGVHRRKASKEQISEYLTAFQDYVVYTYSTRLEKFAGERIEVTGTRKAGNSKTDIFVVTNLIRNNNDPIPLIWRVRERKGSVKIIDVEIEGTSQILTYKQEFASVIKNRGNGVDGLIVELREKNSSLQAKIAANG